MEKRTSPFGLRMPDEVRSGINRLAKANRRSMNAQIVMMLEKGIAAHKPNEKGA